MEVGAAGQVGVADLHHWPHDDDGPFGPRVRQTFQQREVHPFVHDAIKTEARGGELRLILRLRTSGAGGREVGGVDAGWKGMDRRMARGLCLVETVPAGEDEVAAVEQPLLKREKL